MRKRHASILVVCMISFITIPAIQTTFAGDPSRPPNIVIIFTDDQGYGDVGCYGAKGLTTPNLDRMAREGMRFTDFYVAQPVCSSSRTALLTGCYPNRLGIVGALGPRDRHGIHDDEMTLGELCKSRDHATAIFGKWHLGHHPQFLPLRHGFDEYLGLPYSNDMWPNHPTAGKQFPELPLIEGTSRSRPQIPIRARPDDTLHRARGRLYRQTPRTTFPFVPGPQYATRPPACLRKVPGKIRARRIWRCDRRDRLVGRSNPRSAQTQRTRRPDAGDVHLRQRAVACVRRSRRLGRPPARRKGDDIRRRRAGTVHRPLAGEDPGGIDVSRASHDDRPLPHDRPPDRRQAP